MSTETTETKNEGIEAGLRRILTAKPEELSERDQNAGVAIKVRAAIRAAMCAARRELPINDPNAEKVAGAMVDSYIAGFLDAAQVIEGALVAAGKAEAGVTG